MSSIIAGTVLGAGLQHDSDTTGNLVIKTGPSATTAATFHGNAVTTFDGNVFAGNVHVGNIRLGPTDFYGNTVNNGWQRLPGGLIMQWGSVSSHASATVTFPVPFITACFSVVATGVDTPTVTRIAAVSSITVNSFLLSLSATGSANWIAIGK